jgi:hypothetical protein
LVEASPLQSRADKLHAMGHLATSEDRLTAGKPMIYSQAMNWFECLRFRSGTQGPLWDMASNERTGNLHPPEAMQFRAINAGQESASRSGA